MDKAQKVIGVAVAVLALLGGIKAWILLPERVEANRASIADVEDAQDALEGSVQELVTRVTVLLDRLDRTRPPGPSAAPPPLPGSDNRTIAPPPPPPPLEPEPVQRKIDKLLERLRRRGD